MGIGEMLYDPQRVRMTWGPIEIKGFTDGAITYPTPTDPSTVAFDAYLRAAGVSSDDAARIVLTNERFRDASLAIMRACERESLRAFADMLRDPLRRPPEPTPAVPPAEPEDDGMVWI